MISESISLLGKLPECLIYVSRRPPLPPSFVPLAPGLYMLTSLDIITDSASLGSTRIYPVSI